MFLQVKSSGSYELAADAFLIMMVEPPLEGPSHRVVTESLLTTPTLFCDQRRDLHGNLQRHISVPKGEFHFEFSARVETEPNTDIPEDAIEHPPREIPADVTVYTLPSRYCQSDMLTRMAETEFGHMTPGGSRVRIIADWVRGHVEYRYGTTNSMTSAFDTATERVGVCRDFAHLVIAFCRALCIPARYVSGYALGLETPDFHGFAQVYLGGTWHNVDATCDGIRPALVPIAVGRDAADVAITTLWVPNKLQYQNVAVYEEPDNVPRNSLKSNPFQTFETKPIGEIDPIQLTAGS